MDFLAMTIYRQRCFYKEASIMKTSTRHTNSSRSRSSNYRQLTQKVLLGLMSAQMMMVPLANTASAASEIVKFDSDNNTVTYADGVFTVLADKMENDVALNRFSVFTLDAGNIANLFFHTKDNNTEASKLFNFVDGHIDINGTVNAIQNSGVGGNLFFLSSNGITVGATGVINAGAINLMTPTKSAYSDMIGKDDLSKLSDTIVNNNYAINPEGTISVAGSLNAVDGIKLRTANVDIKSTATLRTGTAVKDVNGNITDVSDAINFADLVNIKNSDGSVINAGITGNTLTASTDAKGDIVLSAISASSATAPSEEKFKDAVVANFTPMRRDATITTAAGSNIVSRGSANIYATATNADEGWSKLEEGGYSPNIANPLGQVVFTKADINLGGSITAKENIDVEATSSNEYKSDNDTTSLEAWGRATGAAWTNRWNSQWNIIKTLHDTINLRPIYSYMDSAANVTVAETAKLEAMNKSDKGVGADNSGLLLSASSTAINKVYATSTSKESEMTGGVKTAQAGTEKSADTTTPEVHPEQKTSSEKRTHLAGAAISYDGAYSNANVTVNGDVKAKNDVAVTATSKTDVKAKASENGAPASSTSTSSKLNVAVAVLTGGNHSNVTIGKDATVESTGGSITASANAENKFEVIASVTSNAEAVGSTAVGVNIFSSDAKVEVDGALTSANDTTISAVNDTPVNGVTVSNDTVAAPEKKNPGKLSDDEAKNVLADKDNFTLLNTKNFKDLISNATTAVDEKKDTSSVMSQIGKYADLVTVGASVGVGISDIDADVTIGKTAKITAGNELTVKAEAPLEDIYMSSMSAMENTNPDGDKAMVGAAVMVSDIKNKAHVTVADGTTTEHATLNSKGTMTITADSTQVYDRIGGILYDLNLLYSGFKSLEKDTDFDKLSASDKAAYTSTLEQVGKIIQDINATKSATGIDITKYTTNLSTFPTSAVGGIVQIGSLIGGLQQIVASYNNPKGHFQTEVDALVKSFQNQFLVWTLPESYFHYSVDSSASNASGSDSNSIAVAGSVNVNLLQNTANVAIGNNTELISTAGAIDIDATAKQDTAVLNGKPNVGINPSFIPDSIEAVIYGSYGWQDRLKGVVAKWKDIIYVSPNTDAPNAIGGVVGVAEHSTEATVNIGTGATLTGHDTTVTTTSKDENGNETAVSKDISGISINTENKSNTVDISFGAGKAGNIGFEGLFSWLGGKSTNTIDIDGATLTSFGKGTTANYGNIDLLSHTNNILTNVVGAVAWGSGGASMGASIGVLDFGTVNDIAVKNSTIQVGALDVNALTDGVLNNVAIAGSLTTENAQEGTKDPHEIEMTMDDAKKIEEHEKKAQTTEIEMQEEDETSINRVLELLNNPSQGSSILSKESENLGDTGSNTTHFQLAAAGSAAINVVSGETKATIEDSAVNISSSGTETDGHVNMKADDASYAGAYTGAAAINWQQSNAEGKWYDRATAAAETYISDRKDGKKREPATVLKDPKTQETKVTIDGETTTYSNSHASAALAGVIAMNVEDKTVASEIKNTTITDASSVKNIAQKDGASVAAGLALAASKKNEEEGASAFDLSAAASFNEVSNKVDAKIENSTITTKGKGDVTNVAYDSDTQVAGGANVSFVRSGKTSAAAGAMVSINDVHNNIDATIKGGTITTNGGTIQNNAAENLTQIGTSIGLAAATGGNSGVALDLTLASNNAENHLGATIDGATLKAGAVDNAAYDASDLEKTFDQIIENNSVNVTGSTYTENATKNAATEGGSEADDFRNRDYDINTDSKGSTKQITAAFSVTGSTQSNGGAVGGAATISTLRNEKTAAIKNGSTITATDVANSAASDALMVSVAAGASVTAGTLSGAGSASVQYTTNNTTASIDDSTITANTLDVAAKSNDLDVNVAGQAGYGKNGIGLAIAFNHLGNKTGAYLRGSDVEAVSDSGVAVTLAADNSDTIVSVGAGVNGGQTAAVNGSIAANQGRDDAEAIIDESTSVTDESTGKKRTTIEKANKVTVNANDESTKVAVAGAINGAGTAAVGGAVAYNEIGTWEKNGDATYKNDAEQQTHAAVNHADITTAANVDDAGITVATTDKATIGTAATGIGGSGTVAVEGAASISVIAREAYSEMTDTTVKKADGATDGANVSVTSASEGSIYNNALVIAGAADAAVGAGVAVDYDNTDNTAKIAGGNIAAKNARVKAETKDKILNIGVGGAASTYAGVTGSVGVNILGGHTVAGITDTALDGTSVGGATITSDGNVIVDAERSGSIDNIAGVAAGSGTGASVGLSVAVNDIQNEVSAEITGSDTSITAKGGTAEAVSDRVADDAFLTKYPADIEGVSTPASYMNRKDSSYTGVAVSASSTNEIHDYTLNVGANGIGASVNGNVTVNAIGGATNANVTAGNISTGGDINVVAHDYANNTAYTGTFSVAGFGAGIGVGTTTLTIDRKTSATMTGTAGAKANVNSIGIGADSEFAVADITAAVGGSAFAGVEVVNNNTLLKGKTTAALSGYDMAVGDGLDVSAQHGTNLYTVGLSAGIGAGGVGLGIDVVQDDSETTAELKDGKVTTKENGKGDVTVTAESSTHDNYKMIALSGGAVGASTNVSVGNFGAQTTAHVANMAIGDATNRAGVVDIHAKNTTDVTADTWQGSAGAGAIGVGVQIATIGSDTDTSVENSAITAKTISVAADDEKKAKFQLGNTLAGGIAGGVNVGVLTVGHKVEDTYSIKSTAVGSDGNSHETSNDSGAKLSDVFSDDGTVNKAMEQNRITEKNTLGTGISAPSVQTNNGTNDDGGADAATTNVTVTSSTLDASDDVTVKSDATVNVKDENIYAGVGIASISGQVGVLDTARNASVNLKDSTLAGQNVTIDSKLGGTSELAIYQGSAAAISAMGAFGFTRDASANSVTLDGSNITASADATAKTTDESKTKLHMYAVNAAIEVAASFQLAEADYVGSTAVTLGSGNKIHAKNIDIAATSSPDIETNVNAGSASVVATGGVGISTAEFGDKKNPFKTTLNVADGNTFVADSVNLSAVASPTQKSELASLSMAVGESGIVNYATNSVYSDVEANIGDVQYGDEDTSSSVTIDAKNNVKQDVFAGGASANLLAAIANNTAKIDNNMNTTATASGAIGSNISAASVSATGKIETEATSSSFGGTVGLGVAAAETNVTHTSTTTANIGGTWDVTGDVNVSAKNDETMNTSTDTTSGGLANGSGGELTTDVTDTANVNIKSAKITSSGTQNISAVNTTADSAKMMSSGFGFFDSADATRLHMNQKYTGGVSLDGAALQSYGGGDIKIHASTEGSYFTDNDLKATSAGVDETLAYTTNYLTDDNDVTVKDSSIVTSSKKDGRTSTGDLSSTKTGSVTLAAYDDTVVNDTMLADSEGVLAGATGAHLDTHLTRENDVTITGSSKVKSSGNANLYTSRDEDGGVAGTELTTKSETYNRTFIPFTNSPDIDLNLSKKNIVTVDSGASVESVKDVNIAADKGSDSRDISAKKYVWYTDSEHNGDVTVKEDGITKNGGDVTTGEVNINGTVTAGIHNTAVVNIEGTVTKNDNGTPDDKTDDTVNFDGVTITVAEGADWLSADDFKKTVVENTLDENGNQLGKAAENPFYKEYEAMVKAQAEQPAGSDARKGIDANIESLCDRMAELGYAYKQKITDDSGNVTTKYVVYRTIDMAAIETPDLTVSGGNVSIDSDKLTVTGSLTANSASKIEINNSSNASLIINDAIIPKSGGTVYFNSARLDSGSTDAKNVTGVEHIKTSKDGTPFITISNTGASDKDTLGHTPDIDVKGEVQNEGGSITLENANGSIRLEPDSNVVGATVTIKADNGNVVQIDPDAKFSVAGSPIARWLGDPTNQENIEKIIHWAATEKNLKDISYSSFDDLWNNAEHGLFELCKQYNADEANTKKIELKQPDANDFDEKNGIVAGGLVAISGHSVNINGLIQSGYSDYTVTLDSAAKNAINRIANSTSLSRALSDDEVRGNDKYCIQKGGSYYDPAAKCYKYHVALYYNPGTNRIVASDVTAGGGSVYVKGNIASTGNGRILVAAGTANIDINTESSDKAVALGTMENTMREGKIDIYDNLHRDASMTDHYHFDYQKYIEGNADGTFRPYYNIDKRTQYMWTGGALSHTTTHYTSKQDSWLFGSIKTDEKVISELKYKPETKVVHDPTVEGDPLSLKDFVQLAKSRATDPSDEPYFTISTTITEDQTNTSPVQTHKDEKGLFGWIKTEYTYTWDEATTKGTSTVYAVNGDFDIKTNAITPSENDKGIKVHADGDIIADHNITSAFDSDGQDDGITLASRSGSVAGKGTISTTDLTVRANTGIGLTHASLSSDKQASITLDTNSGDVLLNSKLGDVVINSATSKESDGKAAAASITAAGSILSGRTDDAAAVSASSITLITPNGSIGTIGTDGKALTIDTKAHTSDTITAPSVTASAYGNIFITETNGDLPVNTITSTTGDVRLETKSGSITNVSDATTIDRAPADSLIAKWQEMGIISSSDTDDSNTYAAKNALETRLAALEARFKQLALLSENERKAAEIARKKAAENGEDVSDLAEVQARTAADYVAAATSYANDETLNTARSEYVEVLKDSSSTAAIAAAKNSYKNAIADYFTRQELNNVSYSDEEKTAISNYGETLKTDYNVYGWTKNELKNALTAGVINRTPGTVSLPDAANVTGKTVTLIANGGGIGTKGETKTIKKADIVANMDILRNVYMGGAVWNYSDDGTLESVTVDTSRPLYVDNAGNSTTTTNVALSSDGNTLIGTLKNKSLTLSAADSSGTIGNKSSDMVLVAGSGISTADGTTLVANNMTMNAGAGSIGTSANALNADIYGTLKANAKDSLFLYNGNGVGMTLSTITVGDDIDITSRVGINMESSGENNSKNTSRLTAGNAIRLKNDDAANVGTADNPIRITANGAAVSASAPFSDIALAGKGTGTLVLDNINNASNITVSHEDGTVALARTASDGKEATNADIKANNVTIEAKAIDLTGGTVTAKNTYGGLTFSARDTITQNDTADSAIIAPSGTTVTFRTGDVGESGGTIDIESKKNEFDTVFIQTADENEGITGAINVKTNAPQNLTMMFGAGNGGSSTLKVKSADDFDIKNLVDGAAVSIGGKLETTENAMVFTNDINALNVLDKAELTGKGGVTLTGTSVTVKDSAKLTATDDGDIDITATTGDADVDGTVTAKNIGIIAEKGNVTLKNGEATDMVIKSGKDTVIDTVKAENSLNVKSGGGITTGKINEGLSSSSQRVSLIADGNIKTSSVATKDYIADAGKDITITSGETISATGSISITADGKLELGDAKNVEANESVTLASGDSIALENVKSTNGGNVKIDAKGDVNITNIGDGKTVNVTVSGRDITATNVKSTDGGDVTVDATGEVNITNIGADENGNGATQNVTVTGNDVKATSVKSTNGGNVTVDATGNVEITSIGSDKTIDVKVAGNDITAEDVTSTNSVNIVAQHDASVSGALNTQKVNVVAKNDVTLKDGTQAQNSLTAIAGNDLIVGTGVKVTDTATFEAKNNVTVGGGISTETGGLVINAFDGNATVEGALDTKNALITAGGAIEIDGDANAKETFSAAADKGISVDNVTAEGALTLTSANGDVNVNGNATTNDLLIVNADSGNATISGNATAKDMNITTTNGDATISGDATADNGMTVTTNNGNATINGNATAKDMTITTTNGDATISGDATADNGMTVTTDNGNATINGNATAKDMHITTTNGDATISGNATADNRMIVNAGNGNVDITGNASGTNMYIHATGSGNDGDVNVSGTTNASNTLIINADGNIDLSKGVSAGYVADLESGGSITTTDAKARNFHAKADEDINVGTVDAKSTIYLDAGGALNTPQNDMIAENNIDIHSGEGIEFDSVISTNGGNVTVSSEGDVDIKTVGGDNTVNVSVTGNNVTTNDITATDTATINGNTVNATTINAANANITGSSNVEIDKVTTSGDTNVKGGDVNITNVKADSIATINGNTVNATTINATNANVTGSSNVTIENVTTSGDTNVRGGDVNITTAEAHNNAQIVGNAVNAKTINAGRDAFVMGDGDVNIDAISANKNAYVDGFRNIDITSLIAGENATVDGLGTGNITVTSGSAGGNAYIRQNIAGNLTVSDFHTNGMARFTTRGGDMDLRNISTESRIGIFNFGRSNVTHIENMTAPNLIAYLAFNQDFGDMDARVLYDILTAGDPARRAIGWKTAGYVGRNVSIGMELFKFDHHVYDFSSFIGLDSSLITPIDAENGVIIVADDNDFEVAANE